MINGVVFVYQVLILSLPRITSDRLQVSHPSLSIKHSRKSLNTNKMRRCSVACRSWKRLDCKRGSKIWERKLQGDGEPVMKEISRQTKDN